ncbi:MAG: ABC transporter permease subunit, partial [Bacteroidota bacterium]
DKEHADWSYCVLPVICYSILPTAFLFRWVNKTTKNELSKDYVKTALAKGSSDLSIRFNHVLKNLSPELLALLGYLIPAILSGSVLIETIFNVPGIGWSIFQASESKDLPVLSALILIYLLTAFVSYFISDIMAFQLDKRRDTDQVRATSS